ncbi:Nucleotidyl transferase AbiEii toxin, Type IV TA system [Actinokineospora globicatena]|nr:Nucleotidyl transferase AbiEii toxin, Type IV TA system [Actinokineospora globicatena]GLW76735.1 hypothetical protein Aglo01_12170 [Actinokineospora globicatena]GLW83568.1 hypothetical protein Aglo02_12080 [Actinokineospora globicatena]
MAAVALPPKPRTPSSYLASQKDRAKNKARETGGSFTELLQLHFHRRLIARVFHGEHAERWVLKGGQAMLVRWPAARYSSDIDLLSTEDTTAAAVEVLKVAAALRLDDEIWFGHLSTSEQVDLDNPTRNVRFRVMFEQAPLAGYEVNVDVVAADHAPRGTVTTEPLDPVFTTECAPWPEARLFPVEDHVADKICAMYELYQAKGNPSSRYKDLVDLALFAVNTSLSGIETHRILRDEAARRVRHGKNLTLPAAYRVPSRDWSIGYRKAAQGVGELPAHLRTLDGVHDLANAFITPLLRPEPPAGKWRPLEQAWR